MKFSSQLMKQQMSDLNVAFENLKKSIIRKSEDSIDLEKVKASFSSLINSKRSLSQVKNLNDIFILLEQRDVLDSDNISALEYLAELLQNKDISKLIQGYKKLYIESEYTVCICGQDVFFAFPIENPEENSLENKSNDDLQVAFNNIAMNIGKKWRLLASELKIPEYYVDEVRKKYPSDFYQQALNILNIWKMYNPETATMEVLKMALEARLCKMRGLGLHMLKPVIQV